MGRRAFSRIARPISHLRAGFDGNLLPRKPTTQRPTPISDLLGSGLLNVEFGVLAEREALRKLIYKYADLPMSLADACAVRMTDQIDGAVVFTTDNDFRAYRKNGRQLIPLIMPE